MRFRVLSLCTALAMLLPVVASAGPACADGMPVKDACCCDDGASIDSETPEDYPSLEGMCCCQFSPAAPHQTAPDAVRPSPSGEQGSAPAVALSRPRIARPVAPPLLVRDRARAPPGTQSLFVQRTSLLR